MTRGLRVVGALGLGLTILHGCRSASLEERRIGRFRSLQTVQETRNDGRLQLSFVPEAGENALIATATPLDDRLTLVRELSIDGTVVYDSESETASDQRRTNAGFVSEVATINWPITPDDLPLVPGAEHTLVFGSVDAGLQYGRGELDVRILLASDSDPVAGVLPIDLVYYGAVADDPALVAATEAAIDVWIDLYADVGITLDITSREVDGPPLPPPTDPAAADQWTALAESDPHSAIGPVGRVHLVLSPDDVPGSVGALGAIGVAGDIPGPLVPSPRSGIRMVPERICGTDGDCDALDVRTYGELMAHEVGHHLGLFHPTEDSWDRWDAHSDTAECTSRSACEASLGSNVMFPYVVCRQGDCPPQSDLTPQQIGSMHAYTGVD